MIERYFLTRHSIKPKEDDLESEKYKGISKQGELLARESAMNLFEYFEKETPKDAVIFLGGVSEEVRTKSTAQVYGERLKEVAVDNPNYIVIIEKDIDKNKGYSEIVEQIKQTIKANPDKKIIIDFPLFLKELSLRRTWTPDGKPSPFMLLKGGDFEKTKEWIAMGEKFDGPSPEMVAKKYENALKRLEKFARKYIGDRPLVVGMVGHSVEADAYLAYLAGNGNVDLEILDKISNGEGLIKETELATIEATPDFITISYRGRKKIPRSSSKEQ